MPNPFFQSPQVSIPKPLWDARRVCIPIPVIPIALGALESRAYKTFFAEGDDANGMQLIRRTQVNLIKGCDEMALLYRLLDSTFNGQVYTTQTVNGAQTIVPPIPPVPTVSDDTFIKRLIAMENRRSINQYAVAYGETVPPGESTRELIKQLIAKADAGDWTLEEKAQLLANIAELLVMLA